jgi:hypothetical protein
MLNYNETNSYSAAIVLVKKYIELDRILFHHLKEHRYKNVCEVIVLSYSLRPN